MTIDLLIAAVYCLAVPLAGVALSRKASVGLEAYFLGNRRFGSLLLGVSGMADWFDLSGTMVITSFLFLMGPRGLYVEFRGGAVLILAFLMLWTGKWHRRSGCMTAAEWITFRFGEGRSAEALRTAIALFNVIVAIGMLAYIVRGSMIFFAVLLPYPPMVVTAVVTAATVAYTVGAGFYGVTVTNLLHGLVILTACLLVGGMAWLAVGTEGFSGDLATRVTGVADWTSAWPALHVQGLPAAYGAYEGLAAFAALCLLRTVVGGMGLGSETRYFAARDDRACGIQSLLQGLMIAFRWPLMIGFAVLGILVLAKDPATAPGAVATGFAERVIPAVLVGSLPPVIRGIVLSALLAAMMSTLACAVNSAAATCVRDLYQNLFRRRAGNRELMGASYLFSILISLLGFWVGVGAPDLNRLWGWLAMGLTAGNCGPLFLRLYWWRCNAAGAATGILCGAAGTIIQRLGCPAWGEGLQFAVAATCSFGGTVVGSLLTAPVSEAVSERFVRVTRPFGLWGKYARLLSDEDRQEYRRDLGAVPFVMLAQVTLFVFAMQAVLHNVAGAAVSGAACLCSSFAVWRLWGRHL
jgi:Na+/proline symporter